MLSINEVSDQPVVCGRLGVITGAGGFAARVLGDVVASGFDHALYSWTPHRSERRWINILEPDECIKVLQEDGITDVIHAGTFGVSDIFHLGPRIIQNTFSISRILLELKGLRRGFFQPYDGKLRAAGIVPRAITELFKQYQPTSGVMGAIGLATTDEARLQTLKQRALDRLRAHQPTFGVAQGVVFDGDEIIAMEAKGTDAMIRSLPMPVRSTPRVLVKVLPDGLPPQLDPPTIGRNTIEEARKKGVAILALDARHGLVIDREGTIDAANSAEIALVGV